MISAILMGAILVIPVSVFAANSEDSYLGDNGKMEMQLDRATKTIDEKNTDMDTEQTELEKMGITLFTPEAEKKCCGDKGARKETNG